MWALNSAQVSKLPFAIFVPFLNAEDVNLYFCLSKAEKRPLEGGVNTKRKNRNFGLGLLPG